MHFIPPVAWAAIRSKTGVLLLLIYCFIFLLFLGGRFCVGLCFGIHYFMSVAFNVFWMSCYHKCTVALPHGAMGWSAVCDVVFPDHTHFFIEKSFGIFLNSEY